MPKHYCPSCGAGNEYSLSVPKFCGQCGSSFGVAAPSVQVVASQPQRPKLVPYRGDDDDDDIESGSVRVPVKLDIEWEVEPRQKVTLGSVMQGSEESVTLDKSGKKLGKKAVKERVEQWRSKLQTTQRHEIGGSSNE